MEELRSELGESFERDMVSAEGFELWLCSHTARAPHRGKQRGGAMKDAEAREGGVDALPC